MKICLISTGLGMGGAERQVCDLADTFISQGHSVMLISLTGETIIRPNSKLVQLVELKMTKSPASLIKSYISTCQIINLFQADVVHSHMIHANLFARFLRLNASISRLICTAHSSNEGGVFRMLAYRLTDFLCHLNTNVSQEAVDISVKKGAFSAKRVIAMCNGIDVDKFNLNFEKSKELRLQLGMSEETPLILAVGRLTAAKDYPNLLAAFNLLILNSQDSRLVIIGEGEEKADLIKLADSLGLTHRIHFLGLRRDVCDWMSVADLYVMSSAWEGMPLVLLEAMACERVVVATDCGGVKEVVGDCGYVVKPNDPVALAEAILRGLSLSSVDKSRLGLAARKRVVQNFSLSAISLKWLNIYNG